MEDKQYFVIKQVVVGMFISKYIVVDGPFEYASACLRVKHLSNKCRSKNLNYSIAEYERED